MTELIAERFVDSKVTYTLALEGRIIVVENVPARLSIETGEQYFSPETTERLQKIVSGGTSPDKLVSASVYEFAA